jgi:coenzyme F420-dependent glucose-6-phosphate dehydrogenase
MPSHFEQASQMVREDDIRESIICGPDPQRNIDKINEYFSAGFDHVYIHQIGPDQEGFFRFYREQVMPKLDLEARAPVLTR